MVQLKDNDGSLFLGDYILIRRYPEGDFDMIDWPFKYAGDSDETAVKKAKENLACALYDEYERGNLGVRTVMLPNGEHFNIDANMPKS